MSEAKLQAKIIQDLKRKGWIPNKIILCSNPGWVDVEAFKNKRAIFIEVKDEGAEARPLQKYRHEELRSQGFDVYVIDTWEQYQKLKIWM